MILTSDADSGSVDGNLHGDHHADLGSEPPRGDASPMLIDQTVEHQGPSHLAMLFS